MKYDLQSKLSTLEAMIGVQTQSLSQGYMHGMLNGLICAHSIFSNQPPSYVSMPRKRTKIRHKNKKEL